MRKHQISGSFVDLSSDILKQNLEFWTREALGSNVEHHATAFGGLQEPFCFLIGHRLRGSR